VTDLVRSRVDAFLAGTASQPVRRGRLVFALDATASRQETWDTACQLQAEMFREVSGLDVQLVYYRGPVGGKGGECKASRWVNDPTQLAKTMAEITCRAGHTQISRVLVHAKQEALQRKISALAFVGDACEDPRDQLIQAASELGRLSVPVFMFQEGHDRTAQKRFQEIAQVTHGAYHRFDQGAAKQLAELLRAVAAFTVGGVTALENQHSNAAKLLLAQVR
jgi:hypothetical protein